MYLEIMDPNPVSFSTNFWNLTILSKACLDPIGSSHGAQFGGHPAHTRTTSRRHSRPPEPRTNPATLPARPLAFFPDILITIVTCHPKKHAPPKKKKEQQQQRQQQQEQDTPVKHPVLAAETRLVPIDPGHCTARLPLHRFRQRAGARGT